MSEPETADDFFALAEERYEDENLEDAIKNYNNAVKVNPSFEDAYFNRAFAKDELGDKKGAINDFSEVIRINPNNADAFNLRGLLNTIQVI